MVPHRHKWDQRFLAQRNIKRNYNVTISRQDAGDEMINHKVGNWSSTVDNHFSDFAIVHKIQAVVHYNSGSVIYDIPQTASELSNTAVMREIIVVFHKYKCIHNLRTLPSLRQVQYKWKTILKRFWDGFNQLFILHCWSFFYNRIILPSLQWLLCIKYPCMYSYYWTHTLFLTFPMSKTTWDSHIWFLLDKALKII